MAAFLSLKIQVESRARDLIYVPTSLVKRGSPRKKAGQSKKEKKQSGIDREMQLKETKDKIRQVE